MMRLLRVYINYKIYLGIIFKDYVVRLLKVA